MANDGPFHTGLCRVRLLGVVTGDRKEGCRIKRLGRAGLDKARGGPPLDPQPALLQARSLSLCTRAQVCLRPWEGTGAAYAPTGPQSGRTTEPQVWVKAVLRAETSKAHGCTLPRSHHSEQTSVKGHFPQSWENWAGLGYWINLACDNSIEIIWKTVLTIHAEVFTGKKLRLSGAH